MNPSLRTFVLSFCLTAIAAFSDEGNSYRRATIRHIESGGIGYDNGYTTLEAFLSTDPNQWIVTPFLDARGHLFDDGRWAANAGIGLRTILGTRAYGINTYYDYRNARHLDFNQIGLGLETLGELFDFRINGYLPVGKKTSNPWDGAFVEFSGHHMIISQKYQVGMKGTDAEFGFHFGKSRNFDFYAAAGPYYFVGEIGPNVWGGKARIGGTYKDFVTLEFSDSYDQTFHNKFQGQIAFNFSFGPKSQPETKGSVCTCELASALNRRMLQSVGRQEIIVVDEKRPNSVAIDPATGLPYFFVFVNNTSSSDGTYESPYHNFTQAQDNSSPNDIIYVFPGDGTTTGMDAGIFLKANQKFWGSGVSHSIQTSQGAIFIPAQSSSSPTITNTDIDTDGNAITLATNNAIRGFTIASARNDAIYGTDPQSLEVSSCTIENTTTFTIQASFSGDTAISLTNNQFLNNANGISLTLNGASTLVCSDNIFDGQTSISESPLMIAAANNSFVARIQNNVFNNNTGGGIKVNLDDVGNANINVFDNTFTNNGVGASNPSFSSSLAILISPAKTVDHCSVAFNGNTSSENQSNALYLHTDGSFTTLEAEVSENTISDHQRSAFVFATPVDTFTLLAKDNTITRCLDNGIAVIASGSTSTGMITINNNIITDIGDVSNISNAMAFSQNFSALTLNIQDNEINRCEGSGILSFPTLIDSLTLNISGNTISNCQNAMASNAGSGISMDNYSSLTSTVANNTFSSNVNPGVAIGTYTMGTPSVCLTLTGNQSDTDYSLTNPVAGTFHLSPCNANTVNTGTITLMGTITTVQSCPDATLCPP